MRPKIGEEVARFNGMVDAIKKELGIEHDEKESLLSKYHEVQSRVGDDEARRLMPSTAGLLRQYSTNAIAWEAKYPRGITRAGGGVGEAYCA